MRSCQPAMWRGESQSRIVRHDDHRPEGTVKTDTWGRQRGHRSTKL
jgi:hypothetical protein